MTVDNHELEQRMMRFERKCREAGVKLTHQRVQIFRQLAQTGDHPDARTVYRGARQRVPTMSLDTVYRTLWLFNDIGLVSTLGPPRKSARFDANFRQHHHFICRQCGMTMDFNSTVLDELRFPPSVGAIGSVETIHVEARGVCHQCATKGKTLTKRNEKEKEG